MDTTVTARKNAMQQNDWPNKLMEPFKHVMNELTTKQGVVIRQNYNTPLALRNSGEMTTAVILIVVPKTIEK